MTANGMMVEGSFVVAVGGFVVELVSEGLIVRTVGVSCGVGVGGVPVGAPTSPVGVGGVKVGALTSPVGVGGVPVGAPTSPVGVGGDNSAFVELLALVLSPPPFFPAKTMPMIVAAATTSAMATRVPAQIRCLLVPPAPVVVVLLKGEGEEIDSSLQLVLLLLSQAWITGSCCVDGDKIAFALVWEP